MGKRAREKRLKKSMPQGGRDGILPQEGTSREGRGRSVLRPLAIGLIVLVLLAGIVLRTAHREVFRRSPDEGVYTLYAKTIAERGIGSLKEIVREYNATSQMWVYPTPIRAGYLALVAGVMKMTHTTDERAAVYVSEACSIISLGMLVLMGLRFFNPWVTLVALLFFAASPMELTIARRAWQDGMLGCAGALLVYISAEIARRPKRLAWYVPFLLCGIFCLLIKESGIVVFGLCAIWLLGTALLGQRSPGRALLVVCVTALGIGMGLLILSLTSGGIANVVEVMKNNMGSVKTNQYAIDYQTGPWYYFLQGFWLLSPAMTALFLAGITGSIFSGRLPRLRPSSLPENRAVLYGLVFTVVAFLSIATIPAHLKNLRYVAAVYVPCYLMSGLGFWYLIALVRPRLRAVSFYLVSALIILALAVAAFQDYQRFRSLFLGRGVVDLVNRSIVEFSQARTSMRR